MNWWSDYLHWQFFPLGFKKLFCTSWKFSQFYQFYYDFHDLIQCFTMVTCTPRKSEEVAIFIPLHSSTRLISWIFFPVTVTAKIFELNRRAGLFLEERGLSFLICKIILPELLKRQPTITTVQHGTFWCHKYCNHGIILCRGQRRWL